MLVFRPYFDIRHKLGGQGCHLRPPAALCAPGNFLVLISVRG